MSRSQTEGCYNKRFPALQFDMPETGLLRVTIIGEGRINSMTGPAHSDLRDLWPVIDNDDDVLAVLIQGGEHAFSAGGDFALTQSAIEDPLARAKLLKETRDLIYNLINCSKPTVSLINGHALGAGLSVALLADISIATRSTRIIDGHTRLGVPAGDHAAIIWPLLCGMAKAKYYLLTCETITGEEAERIGLVSICVEDSELIERGLEVGRRLTSVSPFAVRWTKQALNNWLRMAGPTYDASLALEFLGFCGPDVVEGIAAIKERRAPRFQGATDPDLQGPHASTSTHSD
jgi:enoyl-CoA hydratase/carnithine racemase